MIQNLGTGVLIFAKSALANEGKPEKTKARPKAVGSAIIQFKRIML